MDGTDGCRCAAPAVREVEKCGPPQLRAKAKQKAVSTDGIVLTTTARFCYTADDTTAAAPTA
ncbi:hypothetical protein [Streptomyces sp. CB00455]|uniref:hypothetical protein n=1 Tax=Streptomyces sp. CB00455 TaxID=1703927 RepID=UPI001160FE5B|nr:hypothetical protein [Streptomyces sp. CB00455]